MRRVSLVYFVVLLAAVFCCVSCGLPAAPQPPSLELPLPVADLTASREGNRVVLRWTPPRENTDGGGIRNLGETRICRVTGNSPMERCNQVGTAIIVPPAQSTQLGRPARALGEFVDVLPAAVQTGNDAVARYAVEVLNSHGRSAGLSNQVAVPAMAILSPPRMLTAELRSTGILLTWPVVQRESAGAPPRYSLRVERRLPPAAFVVVAQLPVTATSYEDQVFEWEKTYEYRVRASTSVALDGNTTDVVSDSSPVASVVAHDVFPPSEPSDVQAVYSSVGQQPFIDLVWTASTAPDLAGYNVYRREESGATVKVHSDLVKAPAFRDTQVQAGKRYFYAVSAVDLRGNESAKSAETDETVPNP